MRLLSTQRLRIFTVGVMLVAVTTVVLAVAVDGIRWRVEVIGLKALGEVHDIGWTQLAMMIRPGSPHHLEPLRDNPNPFAVILNPYTSQADYDAGERLFREHCALCHGVEGQGETGPSLLETLKLGDSDWAQYLTITGSVPDLTMPRVELSDREIWQTIAHLRMLRVPRVNEAGDAAARDFEFSDGFRVSGDRIEHAASEPHNWLTYSGSYRSWRHSELATVDVENISELKLAWSLQLSTTDAVEASPIVVDGVMYLSSPASNVLAIDAATGVVIWRYSRRVPLDVPACCGRVNRGVAVLNDRVFIGTLDGYLVALNARTGQVEWETRIAEYAEGYTVTAAPLAVRDKVIVGVAGGEYGIRGFLDAYDASTGDLSWRFYTIPEPGAFGSETWSGEAWRTGGGPTWLTGSFDSELGLLYWGVGNPAPDFNGDVRPGDNLFTNSVIALDLESGDLVWHFQFTPHDEHDWDANQIPVLVDRELDGQFRQLMLWANRNGFYYVLDRATGEFLTARAFVTQNWARYIDEDGVPIPTADSEPSRRGTLTWPGAAGGANWWSPSYNPASDMFYVGFVEAPKVFFKQAGVDLPDRQEGGLFLGSASAFTNQPVQVGVRALHPMTGEIMWEYLRPPRQSNAGIGGILTTSSNLLFVGDLSDFMALDTRSGEELWRVNLGGHINASPVTFAVGGQQMVSIPAGNVFFVFGL